MSKTFYQITKNEKHKIKDKAYKNFVLGLKTIQKILGHKK